MKAEELRVGNLVCECEFTDNSVWQHKVEGILDGKAYFDNGDIWECEKLVPIPLTEEWLVRFDANQYKPVKGLYFIYDHTFLFENGSISLYDPDRCVHVSNKYSYVHQLQNLYFALTGEELKLKEL